MAPVPDDCVEGGPATKGNLVKPSLTVPSYSEEEAGEEEEEEETDKAMVSQAPAREHRQVTRGSGHLAEVTDGGCCYFSVG